MAIEGIFDFVLRFRVVFLFSFSQLQQLDDLVSKMLSDTEPLAQIDDDFSNISQGESERIEEYTDYLNKWYFCFVCSCYNIILFWFHRYNFTPESSFNQPYVCDPLDPHFLNVAYRLQ